MLLNAVHVTLRRPYCIDLVWQIVSSRIPEYDTLTNPWVHKRFHCRDKYKIVIQNTKEKYKYKFKTQNLDSKWKIQNMITEYVAHQPLSLQTLSLRRLRSWQPLPFVASSVQSLCQASARNPNARNSAKVLLLNCTKMDWLSMSIMWCARNEDAKKILAL